MFIPDCNITFPNYLLPQSNIPFSFTILINPINTTKIHSIMALPNNSNNKNFAIGIGIIAAVIILTWFIIWLCSSDPKSGKKIAKESIKEEASTQEESSIVAESGQWDDDKYGWHNYDERYGKRFRENRKRILK